MKSVEGIDTAEGIKNSGGVTTYVNSLHNFLETIDYNADVIAGAYAGGDIQMYTIKVHALKSSARIVGAMELSRLAEQLEEAGKQENLDEIHAHTEELLTEFRAFGEKLAPLTAEADADEKEPIPEDELAGAYEALRELIPQMDYDAVEMILDELHAYRLSAEDENTFRELEKALKLLDWDKMGSLL